ncbi:MAG: NAD(P) transhydrogenase subunit alpha [Candidatus Saccharimonadaceae bacterium]
MTIGIPKEIMMGEARVAASPETVKKFIQDGKKVLIEKDAGINSLYHDEDYLAMGAELISDPIELYKRSDLILKVKEPLFNELLGMHEVDMMHKGQYLITFIHPASPVNHGMVKKLAAAGVTSLTLDGIPRISRAQNMDALTSMSTCAGYKGILMAANDLSIFMPQMFTAVGMLKPAKVLVIGVGVAGLQALATAKRLGAITYGADIRPAALEQTKSLGAKVIEFDIPAEIAVAAGGYANKLSNEWLLKEREVLAAVIPDMDIIFCSALIPGKVAPIVITEEMVKTMKKGSVIVDVSIDQGGNCEITTPGKKEIKHGIMIQGIKNIPGLLPTSSTWMFANNVYNLVKYLAKDAEMVLDLNDEIVRSILVTFNGEIVHEGTKEAMGIN